MTAEMQFRAWCPTPPQIQHGDQPQLRTEPRLPKTSLKAGSAFPLRALAHRLKTVSVLCFISQALVLLACIKSTLVGLLSRYLQSSLNRFFQLLAIIIFSNVHHSVFAENQELPNTELAQEVDLVIKEIPVEYTAVDEQVPSLWNEVKPKVTIKLILSF